MKLTSWKRVCILAGSYLGFMIGTGVATGQEILQYYTANGYMIFGTAVVIAVIFIVANYGFALAGRDHNATSGQQAFIFYNGTYLGKFFDWFTVFFCYLSYCVMVAGGAATLQQQYGVPVYVGAAIVAILAGVSVALGLGKLVDIIGRVTPAMLFAIVGMLFVHLVQHYDTLMPNMELISSGQLDMTRVGSNWFMSGMSNGGYSILMLANFSAVLGARENFQTLFRANVLSTVLLVVLNTIIGLSIMTRITDLYQVQIPNLVVVASLSPGLTTIFGVLIFIAVYTTACPLLWTAVARAGQEGTMKYKSWAFGLAALGFFFGMFVPYHMMLNYVYGLNGYIGFIVMALMSIKLIRMKFFGKGSGSNAESSSMGGN